MMKKCVLLLLSLSFIITVFAQIPSIEIVHTGTNTSIRGLSVVNDQVIWVSGSRGTIGRSANGGKTWTWSVVKGFEKTEFRDIEGFDGSTAIIMAIESPARILKTVDAGKSWKIVFEDRRKGMFLDAMDFAGSRRGMVVGDPVDGYPFMATTTNTGDTWQVTDTAGRAACDSGEAFFAASGSNLKYFANGDYFLVSGGTRSSLFTNTTKSTLPIVQGTASAGANAIDFYDNGYPDKPGERLVIAGGDFAADTASAGNLFYSPDGGKTWKRPETGPHGYRSSVEYLSKKTILACGLSGVDISNDNGKTWTLVGTASFNVCKISKFGTAVFLAGNNGTVARLAWNR